MRTLLALLLALALAPAAGAQQKTIYSSLPLQGVDGAQMQDLVDAMRMALEDSGRTDVRYVSLDDSSRAAAHWTPERAARNARRAAQDDSTVAYLGEFNSGATAVSLPILNEAGILQISPSNTYAGLTRGEAGDLGEPEKYYPVGVRTYGRVIPADHTQAHALLAYARELGRRRIALVHDGTIYGRGLAAMARRRAPAYGIRVVAMMRLPLRRALASRLARRIRGKRADALVYGGSGDGGALALWRAVSRRCPRIAMLGGDALAWDSFTRLLPRRTRTRTFLTSPVLAPEGYPDAGRAFFSRFRAQHGHGASPYAIYAYEAMALALDALARGGNSREGALRAFFGTRERASVLGTYSIDPNGDTTLRTFGGYRVTRGGRLRFDRALLARP